MLTRSDFVSQSAYQSYLDTVADLKSQRFLVSQLDESIRFLSDSVNLLWNQRDAQSTKNEQLERLLERKNN